MMLPPPLPHIAAHVGALCHVAGAMPLLFTRRPRWEHAAKDDVDHHPLYSEKIT
jgi:hypothetical protein